MRLLLTLLALLTGLATADRVVAAPAVPAAMGSFVLLAEAAGKAESGDSERGPAAVAPRPHHAATDEGGKPRKAPPPLRPGLLNGSDRALE